jgi:hypothetical protein
VVCHIQVPSVGSLFSFRRIIISPFPHHSQQSSSSFLCIRSIQSSSSCKMRLKLPPSGLPSSAPPPCLLSPAKFRYSVGRGPDLSTQPVLAIETPRELCNPKTTNKYFSKTMDLSNAVSPERWKCIGQILLICTHEEQACFLLCAGLSLRCTGKFYVSKIFCQLLLSFVHMFIRCALPPD